MAAAEKSFGNNDAAEFTLTIHRGEGMCLLAMDWKGGEPPLNFGGFALEYQVPGNEELFPIKNRLSFPGTPKPAPGLRAEVFPSTIAPFQMFRWVHFPRDPNIEGLYTYHVTPVFVDAAHKLTYGEKQQAQIRLARETVPGQLNVAFTRGFIASQAFVERFVKHGSVDTLLPASAKTGLDFVPTHPDVPFAYEWMGLEARRAILDLVKEAEDTDAEVRVIAFDLNLPDLVAAFERIGSKGKLKIIIDDSDDHGADDDAESKAAERIAAAAGAANVKRQHMKQLQHNKMIVVTAPGLHKALGGSTNFSWRGWMVQNNNAVVVQGEKAVAPFVAAFDNFWNSQDADFGSSASAGWSKLGLADVDAEVTFSPHAAKNARLKAIGEDMSTASSNLFYSLAFLSQTHGAVREAIETITQRQDIFVYGISDKRTKIALLTPDGNVEPVSFAALTKNVPEPFKSEPTGGSGINMHHKFVVIDFDKPTARVYMGSYNFSGTADTKNGENLFVIRDQRVATSYMIEALRIFDHYNFRVIASRAKTEKKRLELKFPPGPGEDAWWKKYYAQPRRIKERKLFA